MTPDSPGPFETEAEALQLPAVREVYRQFDAGPGPGRMAPHTMRMLLGALAAAGVYVGRYDLRIAEWLSQWEPATVAVVAGWVTRASQAQMRDGPPDHAEGDHRTARPQRRPDAEAFCDQGNAGGNDGRAPREEEER